MDPLQSNSIRNSTSRLEREVVRDTRRRLRRSTANLAHLGEVLAEKEDALRAARTASVEADRARNRFLANMSHELRTPLHSIIGFSACLSDDQQSGLTPEARHLIRRIHANGVGLLRLVDMLLELSKIEAGLVILEASHVDVLSLARRTAEEARGLVRERPVEVVVDGEEGLDPVETDATKLKQLLVNLVGNAVKYTPAGRVTVRVLRDPGSLRPGTIDVIDTGPGIPPELRPAIAEVLESGGGVTRRDGRTCLGLGIAAGLARQIGGRVSLLDGDGPGAAFRVELPMGIPSGVRTAPPRAGHETGSNGVLSSPEREVIHDERLSP